MKNAYTDYWKAVTTDTPIASCCAAKSAMLSAEQKTNNEERKRFLLHALRHLDSARNSVVTELTSL